jgi:hypothetical protein
MALPTSTTNGATATINGIVYTYNSTKGAWYKQSTASTNVPVTISGTLSVTGNANVGNLGSPTVVNGNSNVTVTANGNITFTSTSNSTMVVTSTGANIAGTANITGAANIGSTLGVTGNANVGNLGTAGLIVATGNITGGNLGTTGTANVGTLVSYTGASISGDFSSNYLSAPASQDAGRIFSISNRTYLAGASYGAADTRVIDFGIGPANVAYLRATGSNGFSLTVSSLSVSGNILPSANITYNLGSTTARWANVYVGDLSLSNGIGDWTIVEGEDDLFIYNNKKDKVYKFNLTEVDPSIAPPKLNSQK